MMIPSIEAKKTNNVLEKRVAQVKAHRRAKRMQAPLQQLV
jgi:hypothetical protein